MAVSLTGCLHRSDYKEQFDKLGIFYEHRLIDDMVAQALKVRAIGVRSVCLNFSQTVL